MAELEKPEALSAMFLYKSYISLRAVKKLTPRALGSA